MRKILTVFSAITVFGTATLNVIACGVEPSRGSLVVQNVNDVPVKAEDKKTDPEQDYVFNNEYVYDPLATTLALAQAVQLITFYIDDNEKESSSDPNWKQFYQYWHFGHADSITYGPEKKLQSSGILDHYFSYKGSDNTTNLNYGLYKSATDKDVAILRKVWWFNTYQNDQQTGIPDNKTIEVPKITDFKDKETITKNGFIKLALGVQNFKITFYAKLNFIFSKKQYRLKKDDKVDTDYVSLEYKTFLEPFGYASITDKTSYIGKISNVTIDSVKSDVNN